MAIAHPTPELLFTGGTIYSGGQSVDAGVLGQPRDVAHVAALAPAEHAPPAKSASTLRPLHPGNESRSLLQIVTGKSPSSCVLID